MDKKNCYRYHSSSQRSLSSFCFKFWTIFSSFVIGRDFYHRQLLVFCVVKIKTTIVTLITSYTNLGTWDSQTWYTFFFSNSYRFYTYISDISICHCVCEVHGHWMSWQFPLFLFEFAHQPIMKALDQCYFSVGLPRTVCAFVSLTLDNILQQYNT